MRNFSKEPTKTYYPTDNKQRPLSLPKPQQKLQLKNNQIQVGIYKYNTQDILGKGYTSKVFKGVQICNIYKRYAIKVIQLKKFRGSGLQMLQAEIDIHKDLLHQNILRLYQIIKTPYFYYLILEYCPHGSLHEYIRQKKQLTERNAVEIMSQILEGYNYLSGHNIMHRDLKPANILRVGNKWKISDFGFAVKSKYGFKDRISVGTPLYMPPQTLLRAYYSNKTDIFALGVILYQMIQGRTPWESSNEKQLKQNFKKQLTIPTTIHHQKIKEFISKCCQLNQSKRMSRDELITYKFQIQQSLSNKGPPSHKKSFPSFQDHYINPLQQNYRRNYEKVNLQYHFSHLLYTCIKNKNSFLFNEQISNIFMLCIFKFSLRLLRLICDKKINHLNLESWQQYSKSSQLQILFPLFNRQLQKQQRQYLENIKHIDIKNIRTTNRKFPDLCHSAPIGQKFYSALKQFLIPLIRQHNHELMIINQQNEQKTKSNKESMIIQLNDKIQALDSLYTIYNVTDIRTNNFKNQEMAISSFKITEDYKESKLSQKDYLDLRRLTRGI